jgi:hypothetical protein
MSTYGRWITDDGLPAFLYDADHTTIDAAEYNPFIAPATRRHFVAIGNRRLQAVVDNEGRTALWDTAYGLRWLTAPDPDGTGTSRIDERGGATWGTAFDNRPAGVTFERVFGPTWFRVRTAHSGLSIERSINLLEGESPWVVVQVTLLLDADAPAPRAFTHTEEWRVTPRFLQLGTNPEGRREVAEAATSYDVTVGDGVVSAAEVRTAASEHYETSRNPTVFGPPLPLRLDAVGGTPAVASATDDAHPTLRLTSEVELQPGETTTLWFRFGIDDGSALDDVADRIAASAAALTARLPVAETPHQPTTAREVAWHAAILTGGAAVDEVIGDHTLDQASTYSFDVGFNGAARDPLQHALPLVYSEPDLALSVLRNTCAWSNPQGEMPYALDGAKRPWDWMFQPSDQPLWALWLASEYAAATGDVAAFDAPLRFHPRHDAEPVTLGENLRRQFRFFVDEVGTGEHGHVRIRNADWNDNVMHEFDVERDVMIAKGESVLNSAMAAWVLPVYAGLCDRLGDAATAAEARQVGAGLRAAVAGEWNGRWFRRAYAPDFPAVGDTDCWLEVQPWAILCGAAGDARAAELLATLDELVRTDSPLGARLKWPVSDKMSPGIFGEGTGGGIWASINMTLIWAAARHAPALGWDEWKRLSLAGHEAAYPDIWEGTVSGPDCYNAPESPRAGRTWGMPGISMQAFPVNNGHAHAQPLLSYLRLLGVEPTDDGALRAGAGDGSFASATFTRNADGSGRLHALGPVVVETASGRVEGGPGEVAW